MDSSATPDLMHSIDRLVVNGRRLFGWGWAAHGRQDVAAVHLRVRGEDWERRIPASSGLTRSDVGQAYGGQLVGAETSGFVVTGYLPGPAATSMSLEVDLEDGTRIDADVTQALEALYTQRKRRRLIAWLASAVWRRVKRGDVAGLVRRARAHRLALPSLDDMNIIEQLMPALASCGEVCLVLDHGMGGGANQYRRELIAGRRAAGQAVLLCTYVMPSLDYRLHLFAPGRDEQAFRLSSFLALEALCAEAPVSEIFVNSPVSFDEPLVLAEWLTRMRSEHPRIRLTVTTHDYFAICPSFVLLDADMRYCGIPPIETCNACLRRHDASFVALSPPTEMGPWRALWGRCLAVADEVRCFSESSRAHLLRAYPALDPARLTLVPHQVPQIALRPMRAAPREPLVIGVVGQISLQKGAVVIRELVERLERDHPGAKLVVVGTLDIPVKSGRLEVTGPYERADLQAIIEAKGVNMLLFPSIWPETFSYVVAELEQLGLPIVAFDLGAPAERLRGNPRARLCAEVSAAAALETLLALRRELDAGPRLARSA